MKIIETKTLDTVTKCTHASSIVVYKGKTIFSWFGGEYEGSQDCSIYVQIGDEQHIIKPYAVLPMWNPVLFEIEDRLFVFVKAGTFCDRWKQ